MNDNFLTLPLDNIAATASPGGSGVTTFTTPSGTPARERMSAIANAVSGVSVAAFNTTVQPAASAGPIFRVAIAAGKFHGVMRSDTPTGSRVTANQYSPLGACRRSPSIRTASSLNQRKNSAAYATSAIASDNTLPFSCTIRVARDCCSAIIRS